MSSWLGEFWRRHRRKFYVSGIVVAGCYAVGKVVQWKVAKWQQGLVREYVESQRKMYYEKNQSTCMSTFIAFEQILRESIDEVLDTVSLTESLRAKPANRIEIWEELKVVSFAKAASSVFSSSITLVYIKLLMNIAAGYMFVERIGDPMELDSSLGMMGAESQIASDSGELHNHCSELIKYATGQGLQLLIKDVRAITKDMVGHIGLKEQLSVENVNEIFHSIWKALREYDIVATEDQKPSLQCHPFVKYMISPAVQERADNGMAGVNGSSLPQVLLEALDVTESNDCFVTINSCIGSGLDYIGKQLAPFFLREKNTDVEQIVLVGHEPEMEAVPQHMAKIMPLVSALTTKIFQGAANGEYISTVDATEHLRDFTGNIYHCFSTSPDQQGIN